MSINIYKYNKNKPDIWLININSFIKTKMSFNVIGGIIKLENIIRS